jgi:plasmid rolling circle replication initiator protein Rep
LNKSNKKARISSTLTGGEIQACVSTCVDNHNDRITRLGTLKNRAKHQENHLWSIAAFDTDKDTKKGESYLASKAAHKLSECGNYLLFKNYYTVDEIKLTKMRVCNQHLLCPFCASIRASRSIQRNNPKVVEVLRQNRKLKPVLLTLTVANGADLAERQAHLMSSFRTLIKRRQDWLKKGWGYNEFCKLQGGFYSYENTYNEKTGEWHPHLHIFGVLEEWIDQESLSRTWHEITGDSMIIDIRRVRKHKQLGYGKAIAEVCKYALKFGDLSVEKTWQAYMVLKGDRKVGLRLSGSFGLLRGVKIDDEATTDDDLQDDLPYLEMLYKFVFGKKSYYDLVAVKQVEPQAKIERGGGGAERPTDRPSEIERGAIKDGRGAGAGCASSHSEPAPQYVRKKAHWQVSPRTRARMRLRIRQWNGFLYNIDLSIYVENRLFQFAYN